MKITLIQPEVVYKDKIANIRSLEEMLSSLETIGDIILLPELFTTGYIFEQKCEIHGLAEDFEQSPTLNALQTIAVKHKTLIVAGVAEKEGGNYYNSLAVIDENGLRTKYRKMSQTNIDKEYFSRGTEQVTFEYMGLTFGLVICFDTWFPEITRAYLDAGVDVLLHSANFGGEQSLHIARGRAIENSMVIATSNRVGLDITAQLTGKYCGQSQICLPSGDYLTRFGKNAHSQTLTLELSTKGPKKVIGVDLTEEILAIKKQLEPKRFN